jgi:hypothetical protein
MRSFSPNALVDHPIPELVSSLRERMQISLKAEVLHSGTARCVHDDCHANQAHPGAEYVVPIGSKPVQNHAPN